MSLETVFAEVLAEHRPEIMHLGGVRCPCGERFSVDDWCAHVAERLAARLASDGYMIPGEPGSGFLANEDGVRRSARPTEWVPVFRVRGEQE